MPNRSLSNVRDSAIPAELDARPLRLSINDHPIQVLAEPRRTLLDVLRVDLGFTGTKKVCDAGNCGACTVNVDGRAMYSCLLLAIDCDGRAIKTIEGLETGGELDPLQQAFIDHDAFQCGYCTSGQIMSLHALLSDNPHPSEGEIVRAVSGNLCRCGAYPNILAAARQVANVTKE